MYVNGTGSLSLLANAVEFLQQQEHAQQQPQFQRSIEQYEDEMKQQVQHHQNQIQQLDALLEIMNTKCTQLSNQHKELINLLQQKQSRIQHAHQLKQQSEDLRQQIIRMQEQEHQLRQQLIICMQPENEFMQEKETKTAGLIPAEENKIQEQEAAAPAPAEAADQTVELDREHEFKVCSMSPVMCARKLRTFLSKIVDENKRNTWIFRSDDLQNCFHHYARYKVTPQCFGRAVDILGYSSFMRRISGDEAVKCYNFEGKNQLLKKLQSEALENLLGPTM
jgi:myosin heavy subunit